jgi:hypothetical protein
MYAVREVTSRCSRESPLVVYRPGDLDDASPGSGNTDLDQLNYFAFGANTIFYGPQGSGLVIAGGYIWIPSVISSETVNENWLYPVNGDGTIDYSDPTLTGSVTYYVLTGGGWTAMGQPAPLATFAPVVEVDPCATGPCFMGPPPPKLPEFRATLPEWQRIVMQVGCVLGQKPDNYGPAPNDSVPQDSTDSTVQTEGQQQLYGPNKSGGTVVYNTGSEVPSAAAGGTAHVATMSDCLKRVPD